MSPDAATSDGSRSQHHAHPTESADAVIEAEQVATGPAPDAEHARMSRGTARVASTAVFRQVIGAALLAATAAIVARTLGASTFGAYANGTAAYYLAIAFTDFGFGLVAAREIAKRPGEEARLWTSTTQVQLAWSALVTVALLGLGLGTGGVRGDVMVVLCPAVLISGFASARQLFMVRYRASPLLIVDLTTSALLAFTMSGLALAGAGPVAIAGALCAYTCLNTITVAVLAHRMVGLAQVSHRDRLGILRMALPIGIASLLASLYFTIDQVLLGWLVPSRDLGHYAAAVKLLSLVVMVPGILMVAAMPGLARSSADRAALSRFAGTLAHWLAVTALPLAVGLFVFARPAIDLAFGHAYAPAVPLLRILMVAGIVTLASNIFGNVLMSLAVIRVMLVFNVISLALNVAGNIVLAPRYGVTASAWLTLACELLVAGNSVVLLRRHVNYGAVLARVWRPVAATLIGAVVGLVLGPSEPYAIPLAAVAFFGAVAALRAWPDELMPVRWRAIEA
jgi:O-antigen/teichoic acid export membrane protein